MNPMRRSAVNQEIGAVILAAGGSRRLGRAKQLLLHHDQPLLRAIAAQVCASSCARAAVVLGADADVIRGAVAGLALEVLTNPTWEEGMASSIRCGVAWAEGCAALVLLVCDQPRLSADHVDRLAAAWRASAAQQDGGCIIASRYAGVLGVPALFPRRTFAALRALRGGQGARELLRGGEPVIAVDWPDGAADVDTPQDAARLLTNVDTCAHRGQVETTHPTQGKSGSSGGHPTEPHRTANH